MSFILHRAKVSSSIHVCPSMFSEKRATAATGATERQRLEQKASEERAMAATGATERQQQEPRKTSKSQKSKASEKEHQQQQEPRKSKKSARKEPCQQQEPQKTSKDRRAKPATGATERAKNSASLSTTLVSTFIHSIGVLRRLAVRHSVHEST